MRALIFISSNSNMKIGKYNVDLHAKYIKNQIISWEEISSNHAYFNSKNFNILIQQQKISHNHPFFYTLEAINFNKNTVTLKVRNITTSHKDIQINNETIKTVKVGKEVTQYAPEAWCIIEVPIEYYQLMIIDITNDPDEIKRLGGKENVDIIKKNFNNEIHSKPTLEYIKNLKTSFKSSYDKYEKHEKELEQENIINYKPEEE